MKPKQLKLLAEWWYRKDHIVGFEKGEKSNCLLVKYVKQLALGIQHTDVWQPHKDSNQLDMLKQKFIKEKDIHGYFVDYLNLSPEVVLYLHKNDNSDWDSQQGKDETECWLTIILRNIKT